MNVGFIGLGNMGAGMASRILKAGHSLTVYNRTRGRERPLVEAGARSASSPADAGRGDVVFTMLADDAAVEAVTDELLPALSPGTVHVCTSTISVALSQRMWERHQAAGRTWLAGPVWGRPTVASEGKLYMVSAGDRAALDRVRPVIESFTQSINHLGDRPPVAHLAKLSGNFLVMSAIQSLAEAFALARKNGIDAEQYLQLLDSTLFNLNIQRTYGPIMAREAFQPAGFRARLGLKDMRLVLAAADASEVPMPLASYLHDALLGAVATGSGDLDWSVVARLAAERAGVSQKSSTGD